MSSRQRRSSCAVLEGDAGVMTGLTAEVLRLSNLEMNEHVRPKLAGAQMLFCTDHYGYTHVREFSFSEQPPGPGA